MKSKFFIANTSLRPVHQSIDAWNKGFVQNVQDLLTNNSFTAEVHLAVWSDAKQPQLIHGVVVELTYSYPNAITEAAQLLKQETDQKSILLIIRDEKSLFSPSEFKMSKTAECKITVPESDCFYCYADFVWNRQKAFLKDEYFNPVLVLYLTSDGFFLQSAATPEEPSFDYWQRMIGKFLRSYDMQLQPAFHFALVKNA